MWVKHLQGIFMRSQLFSFVYNRMFPQKTRTGLIQILAPIRLSVTHQEEFFQAWWAEQIKQLLPCSSAEVNIGFYLTWISVTVDYPHTFLAHRYPLWKFPKYIVCFLVYHWKRSSKNSLEIPVCVWGFWSQSLRVSVQQLQLVAALTNFMKKALHLHWLRICPSLHVSQLCHSCS